MIFTIQEQKLIYHAVRYYQMNRVPLNGKDYKICDDILNKMFEKVVEPPYKPFTERPGGDLDSL